MNKIYYIMGKSASGKDKIYRTLLHTKNLRLSPLILYTTRPIRSGEENGVQYYFVDEEKLRSLREEKKVIEERGYETVCGMWYYFTADEGQIDLTKNNYIGIGTLESYMQMKRHYGKKVLCPIYIDTDDGIRLERALKRERKQTEPKYAEMCRRFLADSEDFSEENIRKAGIRKRFKNNDSLNACIGKIKDYIRKRIVR